MAAVAKLDVASGTQPTGGAVQCDPLKIRRVSLTEEGDRAAKMRKLDHPIRVQLAEIGEHPLNRGGQGAIGNVAR